MDEIHRLNRQVEEVLYPAMEDYVIDVMIGKGESARSIRLNLPKFTLVGATTRAGMLSAPLRDRLVSSATWNIIRWRNFARLLCSRHRYWMWKLMKKALTSLPAVPGELPSLANRLLKRVRDFAQVKYDGRITREVTDFALDIMDVDKLGLDQNDRNILLTIIEKFAGRWA